ncbi:MAG: hypothetical protein OQJ98_00020 [Candidatus Pacebacteria bacterium]|nr:hypothetical protein [Candidatus Paceibacterota bacterium]
MRVRKKSYWAFKRLGWIALACLTLILLGISMSHLSTPRWYTEAFQVLFCLATAMVFSLTIITIVQDVLKKQRARKIYQATNS